MINTIFMILGMYNFCVLFSTNLIFHDTRKNLWFIRLTFAIHCCCYTTTSIFIFELWTQNNYEFPSKVWVCIYFCSPFFEIQQFTTYFEQNSLNYWIVDMYLCVYPKEKVRIDHGLLNIKKSINRYTQGFFFI